MPIFSRFSDGTTISIFGGKITPFWTVPKFSLDPWSMPMLCYTCIYLYIHNIHSMYVCIALHCIVFCHIILHRIYIIYTCIQYMYTHTHIYTHTPCVCIFRYIRSQPVRKMPTSAGPHSLGWLYGSAAERMWDGDFYSHGGTPLSLVGWFISWNILLKYWWLVGVISAQVTYIYIIHNYYYCCFMIYDIWYMIYDRWWWWWWYGKSIYNNGWLVYFMENPSIKYEWYIYISLAPWLRIHY